MEKNKINTQGNAELASNDNEVEKTINNICEYINKIIDNNGAIDADVVNALAKLIEANTNATRF